MKHPNHTWQSWKEYATGTLIPGLPSGGIDALRQAYLESLQGQDTTTDLDIVEDQGSVHSAHEEQSTPELSQEAFHDYFVQYNKLCKEFELWDREEILLAIFMASGSIALARQVLNVGFCLDKLTPEVSKMIFTKEEDALIGEGHVQDLLARKGQEILEDRQLFLKTKPQLYF